MSDIAAADEVEFQGLRYTVEGDVAVWRGARMPRMRDTLTLITRVLAVDAAGNPVRDEYNNDTYTDVPETVRGCSVQPRESVELNGDRAQVTTGLVVYVPHGSRSFQVANLQRVSG